ncbi:18883_t:CDS:2 [Rhizophagus irregularis]|nr:18883_t:CDS:2 [Rhizophagus irregularis]
MSDTKKFIKVIRKEPVGDDIPIRIKLKITDKLSEIREQLQIDSTILMDDTLFFSDRDSNNIMRKRETEVYLEDIIIDDTIYLKTCDPRESNKSSEQKIIGGSSTIATSGIPAANLNIEVGLNNDNSKTSDNDKLKPLEPEYSFCAPVVPDVSLVSPVISVIIADEHHSML